MDAAGALGAGPEVPEEVPPAAAAERQGPGTVLWTSWWADHVSVIIATTTTSFHHRSRSRTHAPRPPYSHDGDPGGGSLDGALGLKE